MTSRTAGSSNKNFEEESLYEKNIVFYVSLLITAVIVLVGLIAPEPFALAMNNTKAFLVDTFGWFYLIAMFAFVVFSLLIAFSRFGK